MQIRHLCVLFAFTLCFGVACSDDPSPGGGQELDAGEDDTGGEDSGGEDGGGDDGGTNNAGDPDAEPDGVNADPGEAIPTPELEGTRRLSDLTTPELELLCLAREKYTDALDGDFQRYLCLATAVDAGQVGADPALTCERFNEACLSLVELREQLPGLDVEPPIESCMFEMFHRRREVCVDPTVDAYKACHLRNIELQRPLIDRASLTCAEAAPQVSIRPQGLFDCPCGVEERIGPPPADDLDWDYVLDEVDACPNTEIDYPILPWGCDVTQDGDQDGVWNEEDRCPNTELEATDVSAIGCSLAQDQDRDDVPDLEDPCPGTAEGAALVSLGCSLAQDEDSDGVPNASDWCPFTPLGGGANLMGCTPEQGEPWSEPYLTELPAGTELIRLGADQEGPVELFYLPSGVSNATAEGFDYAGTLLLRLGQGTFMQLAASVVRFVTTGSAAGEAVDVTGMVALPFPAIGIFEGFRPEPIGTCEFGFVSGEHPTLVEAGLPLVPMRRYIFVQCGVGFAARLGRFELSLPGDRELIMALDPMDPAFFIRGNIDGLGPIDSIEDVAIGLSAEGRIPFVPEQTWEVEAEAQPFDGHLYTFASIPLESHVPSQITSFALEGDVFVDLDPDGDGPPGVGGDVDLRFGANGALLQTLSFFGLFEIELNLGEATCGGVLRPDGTSLIYGTGLVGLNELRLPEHFPVRSENEARAAFVLSSNTQASRLVAEATFRFLGSEVDLPLVPDLLDFNLNGRLEVDHEGIRLTGSLSGDIHPWIDLSGRTDFEAFLRWDRSEYYVRLQGNFRFRDEFQATDIYLGYDDILINGEPVFSLLF